MIVVVCAGSLHLQGQLQVEQGKDLLKQKKISEAIAVLRQATQLYPRSADAWVFLAKAHMQASMPDSAETCAMKAQALDDEIPDTYLIISQVQLAKKRSKEAYATARAGLKVKKDYPPLLTQLGFTLLDLDSADAAVVVLTRAKELDPKNPGAFEGLGDAYTKLGVTAFAVEQYAKSVEIDSLQPKVLHKLARTYLKERKYNDAVKVYSLVVTQDPNNPNARLELGKIYHQAKQWANAARTLKSFVERPDVSIDVWIMYMESAYNSRQYKEAIGAANEVLKKNAKSEKAVRILAHSYVEEKEYSKAVETYKAIDTLKLDDYKRLGRAHNALKQDERTIWAFKEALKLDSMNASLYGDVGALLMGMKKFDEAAAMFEKRFLLDSTAVSAYVNYGMCMMALENYDEASSKLKKAIELNPKYEPAYYNLASAYMGKQAYKDAKKAFEDYIKLTDSVEVKFKKERAAAFKFIGLVHLVDKKYEDALKSLKKSIELNGDDFNGHLWLAQTLHSMQKKDEAIKEYEKVLKMDKDNKEAKKGLEMLKGPQ